MSVSRQQRRALKRLYPFLNTLLKKTANKLGEGDTKCVSYYNKQWVAECEKKKAYACFNVYVSYVQALSKQTADAKTSKQ